MRNLDCKGMGKFLNDKKRKEVFFYFVAKVRNIGAAYNRYSAHRNILLLLLHYQ